jgi:hypothetical protein
VLYDDEHLTYHTLSDSAFAVWQLCDGRRTLVDIAAALARTGTQLPVEAVELAIVELLDAKLLTEDQQQGRFHLDRREALKVAVAVALGGVVLPFVSSITAPVAAETNTFCLTISSNSIGACADDNECGLACAAFCSPRTVSGRMCQDQNNPPGNGGCCLCVCN